MSPRPGTAAPRFDAGFAPVFQGVQVVVKKSKPRGARRPLIVMAASGLLALGGAAVWSAGGPIGQVKDPLVQPSQPSPRSLQALLTAVERAGASARLVAVGERGTILTSDDDGKTWVQRVSPVSVMLTNLRFADAQRGWAVGHSGVVLATTDGGVTWQRQLDGVQLAQRVLKAAEALSGDDGAKAQAEAKQLVDDGADKPLLDVVIAGDGAVLVVGAYGLALRSTDGGQHWEDWHHRIPNTKGAHLYAARRIGPALVLVGEQGSVFRSRDDGHTFDAMPVPYNGSFFGVTEVGQGEVLAFGLRGNAWHSRDGAAPWQAVTLPTAATLTAGAKLQDGSSVLTSQAGNVLRTTDGGATFQPLAIPAPVPFVGLTQAQDGALVLAGVRGTSRATLTPSNPATAAVKQP